MYTYTCVCAWSRDRSVETAIQKLQTSMIEFLEEMNNDQKLECILNFINDHLNRKRNLPNVVRLIPKLIDALDTSKR